MSRTQAHDAPCVLIVEDEEPLVRLIGDYLRRDGFAVQASGDGAEAVDLAGAHDPTVVILDLGLPGMDGVEVCRRLRTFSDCYIIMLTARADEVDRLIGLSVGADDYVPKPFSPRELVLRVKAMLRRPRLPLDQARRQHAVGELTLDRTAREVRLADEPVELTRTEFDLLAAMMTDPGAALSRRELIDRVWGEDWVGDEHLVDVHVGNLRRKLGDSGGDSGYIRTVRGVGYKTGPGR
ncbi:response regulator transcription factor [Nesterenkonia lacusekhoensis]|uniref:DNA-binding response OmpR family regulator n=1 Tax=Nesterenkonia lacusekhoensis TaxID=150832 RepID=A0ABS4T471_9MICC|nr:response regulator transcription factor [Nesterenkonia lacusekhoensis]MBP2319257.1 DNA-binding response OmpR family regulator [Nesterenkonia lacusekhoensis]